jgi:hypothetical protein
VPDPLQISRRVRRRIEQDGLSASLHADVHLAVSTGGAASSRQVTSVRQGGPTRAAAVRPDPEEQP